MGYCLLFFRLVSVGISVGTSRLSVRSGMLGRFQCCRRLPLRGAPTVSLGGVWYSTRIPPMGAARNFFRGISYSAHGFDRFY